MIYSVFVLRGASDQVSSRTLLWFRQQTNTLAPFEDNITICVSSKIPKTAVLDISSKARPQQINIEPDNSSVASGSPALKISCALASRPIGVPAGRRQGGGEGGGGRGGLSGGQG